jgi:hypothetical protein
MEGTMSDASVKNENSDPEWFENDISRKLLLILNRLSSY